MGAGVLLLCMISTSALAQNVPGAQKKMEDEPDLINPDRPGIADGSGVIGRRRIQIEAGVQKEFRSDGGATEHTLFTPALLRIGINDAWEARVEGNFYTWDQTRDSKLGVMRTDGYAPFSVGFKYHWQDSKGIKHPSLGTIGRVFVPSGSGAFQSHRFQGDVRLAADWDLTPSGNWSLNPNVGVGQYDDGDTGTFTTALFALTVNYFNKSKTINPFIDAGVTAPEEKHGRTSAIIDGGIAYIIGQNLQLDASVGTGILGRTPPHPFWSVGISIRH